MPPRMGTLPGKRALESAPSGQLGGGVGRLRVGSSARPRSPRVVLVDDSVTMLDVLKIHLMGRGFELVPVSSAKQALAEIQRVIPNLIITDINMPEMSGFDLCRKLRAHPATATVPMIIISSKLSPEARAEAHALGVRMCLAKPVRPNLLRAAVNQALFSR